MKKEKPKGNLLQGLFRAHEKKLLQPPASGGGHRETDDLSLTPAETSSLASPVEIRFLLPSPPWFETFQVAFLWEYRASGQSDSRKRKHLADHEMFLT